VIVQIVSSLKKLRFEKFTRDYKNTGHSVIEMGFNSLRIENTTDISSLWDKKIASSKCSCKTRPGKREIILATSVICHESSFIENPDFSNIHKNLAHLTQNHNIKAVIGLGINGLKNDKVKFDNLPTEQQDFIYYLKDNSVKVGCRGIETFNFLLDLEFNSKNLYVTGCPSMQLVKPVELEVSQFYDRMLITGSLIKRIDLVEDLLVNGKILFIPQTLDSYLAGLAESKKDKRIEIFLAPNLSGWHKKLEDWAPQIALGSRFHGGIVAMSLGIPTVIMSGDIRTREMTSLGKLKFLDDLYPISHAVSKMAPNNYTYKLGSLEHLAQEIRLCAE
jgi:hypothetical protein